jgi:hypothetical protein
LDGVKATSLLARFAPTRRRVTRDNQHDFGNGNPDRVQAAGAEIKRAVTGSSFSKDSALIPTAATLVFCRASHSVERLALVREELA